MTTHRTIIMLDRDGNPTNDAADAREGLICERDVYTLYQRNPFGGQNRPEWTTIYLTKKDALAIAQAIIDDQDDAHRAAARILRETKESD